MDLTQPQPLQEEEEGGGEEEEEEGGISGMEAPGGGGEEEEEEEAAIGLGEQNLNPELQQGYRILREFLLEKHRPLTAPFLRPLGGRGETQAGRSGGTAASVSVSVSSSREGPGQPLLPLEAQPQPLPPPPPPPPGMWLLKMEEKFSTGQYLGIADFVADFRLMLETCYRLHGVDHWLSKQAQKLEMMLEQKLALLSRHLREKTAIAVTSKGFYGLEDEKGTACTSTRRRSTPRSLAGLTTGVFESVMVQVLRQEEQLRAKEEKRLREQERKEAEEASQKEIEEWEKFLLSQAAPTRMENMWEIPAIGHFLCLAQHILNLPEIVFYELERCLLMPQCSAFLSKIMTSLLSPPHRRSTLHRRPTLPYRNWEAALRQKVQQWYTAVGQTDHPDSCAEKLGLCPQFFKVLGETNPLEERPFHELPFCQKVWLLKGLCDFVYETQKDVQDAVLGQPIHECREVILGYDYLEHAYVHFPQFCGADVRIYKQKPFHAPEFPAPPIKVKRVPRIKLEKVKSENIAKSNGEVSAKGLLFQTKAAAGKNICLAKTHLDLLNVMPEKEIKPSCEEKIHKDCDFTTDCCKENRDRAIVAGENVGFVGPLSPGEIRVVENGEKCVESLIVKTEATPLKENTLKTCQLHVNGNHCDHPDMNCFKVPKDVTSELSVENKTLRFNKVRAKKKKKKKKKLKDILNENLQRKRELHLHSLKSYKHEIQNKLLLMKKKAKHKKHKSGKKSISKKTITKKRKSITKPAVPEFQLICTNLDELRELIGKIENELKEVENIKKKSGRWYQRKQAVKELHCTLIRLLNELLPWEPKLMKAFQRNRSRLKKDYDDFKRQPDHDKFTREQWTNEDGEVNTGKEVSRVLTSDSSEHTEFLKRVYRDSDDMKLSEMNLATGKSRPLRKELTCREIQKIVPKSVKRQSKQNSCLDDSTNGFSPRKRLKLSTSDTTAHNIENDLSIDDCLNKQIESSFSESTDVMDTPASTPNLIKGTKPIQALLAKNIGNKVTLTSQLPPTVGRNISTSEKLIMSTVGTSPVKPMLPCQTSSKNPLQVLYKMPDGHCVPIDLHNNSVKIQVQPVGDGKLGEKTAGEKIMQQVLILPKNFLIHHRDSKSGAKEISSLQQKTTEQHCISLPQPTAINTTLAPVLPVSPVNAAATFLPSTDFKKNTTHLAQGANTGNRFPALPSVVPTGNILATVMKMSHREATKTKTVISAASSPVASPTVSSAVQTLTTTLPQSISVCTSNSSPRLASPQKSADVSEAKQELKTICIRDSQSILVTTRGGNTGIVKVQTNSDQISPNNLAPNSVFTYAPQLQTFLVPKSTQLSNSSGVTTAISSFPALTQSSPTTSVSITSLPASVNKAVGENMTIAFGQPLNSGTIGHGLQKTVHVSPPNFLAPTSSKIVVPPPPPNSSANAASISPGNIGQNTTCSTQAPLINQQVSINSTKYSVTQPESMPITSGNVSGAQIQKLMLVTNPPLLPACGPAGVNLIPASTCTGTTAQKVVFINTPLANIHSNTTLTADSFKQTFSPSMGKTYVKSAEQPQLVLIPSSVGTSIKVNTSPTISQIKDVKIGLNIGQAIINSTGNVQSVPPINIMQPAASKNAEEKNGVTLPLPTSSTLVPVCTNLTCQSVMSFKESPNATTRAANVSTVTTNVCLEPTSVALSGPTTGARPTVLAGGIDTSAKITPVGNTQLRTSNVGNTMAISTVKTGHLASSVLISTSQPAACHPNLTSSFQLPVTVALPGPVNGAPQVMHTVPQWPAAPSAAQCMPLSKGQQSTLVQFQSPGIPAAVPINRSAQKPQTVLPPNTPNTGKVINVSNLVPLPCQLLPPNFVKPVPVFTCAPGASAAQTVPVSPSIGSNIGGQLNETCIQQKIIINTCTPLAPGTQIMISGTRFIVPPQGLGAGSHVLLISTNPKLGPLLTVSNGHGFQGVSHAAPSPQRTTQVSSNTLSWQPSKQPLKSFTKIVNSLGTTNPLPVVHPTPQIVNSATKPSTPSFATTLSTSLVTVAPSTSVAKPSLVGVTHTSNSQLQGDTSVLHLDTSIKKLMVSPEGAILNAIKTPTSKTSPSLSPDIVSTSKSPAVVFPNFLNSSIGVPDTAAS